MFIQETYVDETRQLRYGTTDLYEPFTENVRTLFLALQRMYGGCVSKIYIDQEGGEPAAIGWVFQKRTKYDDCDRHYLQSVWVILHEKKPTVTTEYPSHSPSRSVHCP